MEYKSKSKIINDIVRTKEQLLNIIAKLLMELHVLVEKVITNYSRSSILPMVIRTKKALKVIKNLSLDAQTTVVPHHTPLFKSHQALK